MATRTRGLDENEIQRTATLKGSVAKSTVSTMTTTNLNLRRAALGDLANKTKTVNSGLTKVEHKVGVENQIKDFKSVKSRVDTRWASNAAVLRKPLTRSNSIKSSIPKVMITQPSEDGPKLVRTRSSNIAVREERRIIDIKPKTSITANKIEKNTILKPTVLRRSAEVKNSIAASTVTSEVATIEDKRKIAEPQNIFSHSAHLLNKFHDDIDASDGNNVILVSEYVNDIYAYLRYLEDVYVIENDHLKHQREVLPKMRAVLVDWMNEVHQQYHFVQETFHMSVSILDRYLQSVRSTTRQNLQLVGVAALLIAAKYEELFPPEINEFIYLTDNTYDRQQVIAMEMHVLKKLNFELACPLSIHFLRRFSKAAKPDDAMYNMSKYFIELSTIGYEFCQYRPSEIAAASLFITLCITGDETNFEKLWISNLEYYTAYSLSHLLPIIHEFVKHIQNMPGSKLTQIYRKYSNSKYNSVATLVENSNDILMNLLNFSRRE